MFVFSSSTMLFFFFNYYGSVVYFEVRYCNTSSVALFAQDCFGYSRIFVLPYFSISVKNFIGVVGVAQVVGCLPCKCEALSSNLSIVKKKKKRMSLKFDEDGIEHIDCFQ
jgi:hypothetical protein